MSVIGVSLKKKIISAINSDANNATGGFVHLKFKGKDVSLTFKRAGGCKNVETLQGTDGDRYYPRARIITDTTGLRFLSENADEFVRNVYQLTQGNKGHMFLVTGNELNKSEETFTDQQAMRILLESSDHRQSPDPMSKIIGFGILTSDKFRIESSKYRITSPTSVSTSVRGSPRPSKTIDQILASVSPDRYTNVASCKLHGSLGSKVMASSNNPVQFTVGGHTVPTNSSAICFAASSGPTGTSLAAAKEGAKNFLVRYSKEKGLDFTDDQINEAIDSLILAQERQPSPRKTGSLHNGSAGGSPSSRGKPNARNHPRVKVTKMTKDS